MAKEKQVTETTKRASRAQLQIATKFGGVSIGKTTARIGLKIMREFMTIDQAEQYFCDRRLSGSIRLGSRNEDPKQKTMLDTDLVVTGTFDVKGYSTHTDSFSLGLTFALTEIEIAVLAKFASGAGQLLVKSASEIPDDE